MHAMLDYAILILNKKKFNNNKKKIKNNLIKFN